MAAENNGKNGFHAPATIAVHGGERTEEQPFGAIVSPVFHSTIYGFESFGEMRRYVRGEVTEGYFYSRYANPTVAEVERKIAELEGAQSPVLRRWGSVAASGVGAAQCQAAGEIIASEPIYGGTINVMREVMSR